MIFNNKIIQQLFKQCNYKYYINDKYCSDKVLQPVILNCKDYYNPLENMSREEYNKLKKIYKELLEIW